MSLGLGICLIYYLELLLKSNKLYNKDYIQIKKKCICLQQKWVNSNLLHYNVVINYAVHFLNWCNSKVILYFLSFNDKTLREHFHWSITSEI